MSLSRLRKVHLHSSLLTLITLCLAASVANAEHDGHQGRQTYSVAVLPFSVDEKQLRDTGKDLQTLLNAHLSAEPDIVMVERAEIDAALSEVELGLSGTVDPSSAARIGHITGAQILVGGRAFVVQNELVVVAKIIGVETSRTFGQTATMPLRGSITKASIELARKVADTITANGRHLTAKKAPAPDTVSRLRPVVEGFALPSISVSIPEVNMDREVLDPAAETEISFILQKLGFEIIDPLSSNKAPDIEVRGEAFSEFGLRKGNLVSSKGRLEIKAIARKNGEVILVDRETATAVDLSPTIAGKAAIAKSAEAITERLVHAIVNAQKR